MAARKPIPPEGITASPKTVRLGWPWTNEELVVITVYARRLMAGKYRDLNDTAADAIIALRQWYVRFRADHPDRWPRNYPRTYDATRSKIHKVARSLGRPLEAPFWSPLERKAALRWARKTIGPFDNRHPRWMMVDAARMLLVELMEKGFPRTFSSCENEVRKCRLDILAGTVRGFGRRYPKR